MKQVGRAFAWSLIPSVLLLGSLVGCQGRGALGGTPYYGPGSAPVPAPSSLTTGAGTKFLYVANSGSNDIFIGVFDTGGSGAVAPLNTNNVSTGQQPLAIQGHPSVPFVAVGNATSGDVWSYKKDPITGNLTRFGTPISIGQGIVDIKWSFNGQYLYVLDNANGPTLQTLNFDITTLALTTTNNSTSIGNPQSQQGFNPATGQPQTVATVLGTATGMAISGNFAYVSVAVPDQDAVVKLAPDGSTTIANPLINGGPGQSAIAVYPGGRYVYTTNFSSGDVSFFTIDPNNNLVLNPTPVTVGQGPYDIKINTAGTNAWVVDIKSADVYEFGVNGTTGFLTLTATTDAIWLQNPPPPSPPADPVYGPYPAGSFPTSMVPLGNSPMQPSSICVSVDGKFAYIIQLGFVTPTSKENEGICQFTINPDGTLNAILLPTAALPTYQNPLMTSTTNGNTQLPQPDDIIIY